MDADTDLQCRLTIQRHNRVRDYMNKAARYIIDYCVKHGIGTLVVGYNPDWNQLINISANGTIKTSFKFHTQVSVTNFKGCANGTEFNASSKKNPTLPKPVCSITMRSPIGRESQKNMSPRCIVDPTKMLMVRELTPTVYGVFGTPCKSTSYLTPS